MTLTSVSEEILGGSGDGEAVPSFRPEREQAVTPININDRKKTALNLVIFETPQLDSRVAIADCH